MNPHNCLVHRDRTDADYFYYCMAIVIVFSFYLGPVSSMLSCGHNILMSNIFFSLLLLLFQNFSRTATIRRRRKRDLKMNTKTTRKIEKKKKNGHGSCYTCRQAILTLHNRKKKLTLFGNDHAWK